MSYKFGYTIPVNLKIFKTNYDYYNGIGKFTQDECIDRSLLISGVQLVDLQEYETYVEEHHLRDIFII